MKTAVIKSGVSLLLSFLFTFFLRSKFGGFLLLSLSFVLLSLISHNLFPLFRRAFDQHIQSTSDYCSNILFCSKNPSSARYFFYPEFK